MKDVMTIAWEIIRNGELLGTIREKLSKALKMAWAEVRGSRQLIVKNWLFQKIARENNAPRIWSNSADCIFQETEKAYKIMMDAVGHTVFTWVPKSQCEWIKCEEHLETKIFKSFEEALDHRRDLRRSYC